MLTQLIVLLSAAARFSVAIGAGPNTLAFYNPSLRTASTNGTWMIVPVPIAAAEAAVAPYNLIKGCAGAAGSPFSSPFPSGQHPVLVTTNYMFDIRMASLEIDSLTSGSILVPCTDRLGDGKTPFKYPTAGYIGGADGMDLMAFVPAVVGSLENYALTVANVYPDDQAYRLMAPNEYQSQVKQVVAPNTASGPGAIPAAIDFDFFGTSSNQYTAHTFHALINQVTIIPTNGMCFRDNLYFNETFAQPALRTGTVTLYNVTSQPTQFTGRYKGVGGYSANGQEVGYNPQTCAAAAAANDPASMV